MQVLRLPPSQEATNTDAWSVPLAMLLRSLVEYPSWLVPTSNQGAKEVLQTLIDQSGQPLLVACAGQANLEAVPSPAASSQTVHQPEIRGIRTMPGIELVFRWHQAHVQSSAEAPAQEVPNSGDNREQASRGLHGVVLNPASEGGADAILNEMVLPHLVGFAAAQRTEAALANLASWIPEPVAETAPNEALQIIDEFESFVALLHIAPDGEQHLQTSSSGEALLYTGADLVGRASELLLQSHAADLDGEWRTVRVPLRQVIKASAVQGGAGVEFVYGWNRSVVGANEMVSLRFPSAQLLIDLFAAAGCDLMRDGAPPKAKPIAPGL
eukprot:COSAG02_NODE_2772_length_8058_cov_64.441513_9_plen_326_part_00